MCSIDFSDLETAPENLPAKPARAGEAQHKCPKCNGTGKVVFGYVNLQQGKCFKCNGRGWFKTSEQQRANNRASRVRREAEKALNNTQLFAEQYPAENAWLQNASMRDNNFAQSLLRGIGKYGSLTEKQLAAVRRIIMQDEERAAQREKQAEQLTVDLSDLLHRFGMAKEAGLKRPKIILSGVMFSLAPEHGKNAGCIYVKSDKDQWGERSYLGKVTPEGRFYPSRDCTEEQKAQVMAFGQDVINQAKAHGEQHGNCCFCARELTTDESVANGYGPICAERYGLPWDDSDAVQEFRERKARLREANAASAAG